MDRLSMIKQCVRNQKSYLLPQIDYLVKMNQNENPYDLPSEIKVKITDAIKGQPWNRYPELRSMNLREKLGRLLALPAENVLVGNGSNEILLAVMMTLLEPGKRMVTISPTFSLYAHYGEILGAGVTVLPLQENFQFPVRELILLSQEPDVALTVLCSPNNPTGNSIGNENLIKIVKKASGFVLVDEAYFDFCEQDFSSLLEKFPNLILTRTFSKAVAFSFGRFGYGLAAKELVREIYKVLLPYNLNGLTELAASVLMENAQFLQSSVAAMIEQRKWLFAELKKIPGIKTFPSQANFILVELGFNSRRMYDKLIDRRILVRDVSSYPGLRNHLRISVGTPEENEILLQNMLAIADSEYSANGEGRKSEK